MSRLVSYNIIKANMRYLLGSIQFPNEYFSVSEISHLKLGKKAYLFIFISTKSIFMASNLINKASLILYLPLLPVRYLLKIYSSRLITELKLGSFLWENSGLHSCKQCSGMPICAKEAAIFCRRHSKQ